MSGGKACGNQQAACLSPKKWAHTTRQATQTQPALRSAGLQPFAASQWLGDIPADDRCKTWAASWAAGRTIMLRRTSETVKEVVDKMSLIVSTTSLTLSEVLTLPVHTAAPRSAPAPTPAPAVLAKQLQQMQQHLKAAPTPAPVGAPTQHLHQGTTENFMDKITVGCCWL